MKFLWIILTVIILLLTACAKKPPCTPARLTCPPPPVMLPVQVSNGTVGGTDLDNAIKNHQALWEYIHRIEKLGCTL